MSCIREVLLQRHALWSPCSHQASHLLVLPVGDSWDDSAQANHPTGLDALLRSW